MEDAEMYTRMKMAFNNKIDELIKHKHVNSQIYTSLAYYAMIAKVEHAKGLKFGKTPADYARLKKYDILEIDGKKRLVMPFFCSSTNSGSSSKIEANVRQFVYVEEIFDLLHIAHMKIGHKRRRGMQEQLHQYKNITREMISLYLSVCEVCNEKIAAKQEHYNTKVSYIDLVEMSGADGAGFNCIVLHIDVKTHFVQLRPVKSTEDIPSSLLEIFSIFGPPDILQGRIHRELGEKIVAYCNLADFKITFVKVECELEILEVTKSRLTDLLNIWIESHSNVPWTEGLKVVQYMKNREYSSRLQRSAGETMFGSNFGRVTQGKRTSNVIDNQFTADANEEVKIETTSSDNDESQQEISSDASGLPKRIKIETDKGNGQNDIIIEQIDIPKFVID